MPNDTLSKHLFHWEKQPLPWEMRVRVAYYIAQALDHCNTENRKIYHDLNAYRVLFDEISTLQGLNLCSFNAPNLSCLANNKIKLSQWEEDSLFGPELGKLETVSSYLDEALDLIRGKNLLLVMDSSLEGQYANEDVTELVELASTCLQYEARDRPDVKFLLSALAPLQKETEVNF
ncbi:hypothetical protein FEM48_Zijuj12G0063800 [Ziziphus jujuba var. spinosa]|uniref:Uncharacterized protein n=1 Tax=Ziziphus jujuba var. spinosa TaxID=714518 RepID=A0A978UBP4_ZIZJJ|nr:hypothetical protein FEM48_Zijuj12G0063800 [Ziziphus jujuba var. spinosa]